MKVVVTGLSGNIGTAFLRRHGTDPALQLTGVVRRLPHAKDWPGVTWTSCDIGSPSAPGVLAEAFEGADAVVHLAWAIYPAAGEPPMTRTNSDGTAHVLDAAAKAGVRHLVVASSVAAYQPAPRWEKVAESWPIGGIGASAYSLGKARLEHQLDDFAADHPETAVARIRPCAVVQHDAGGEFTRWLLSTALPERLVGSRWLPLPFWPGLRAQAVHAEDVADAIHTILFRDTGGEFNLAGEQVLTAHELAKTVGGPWLPLPAVALRAAAWATWRSGLQPLHPGWLTLADQAPLIDTRRARDELGWHPRYESAEAIRELAVGMAEHARVTNPPLVPYRPSSLKERLASLAGGRPLRQTQS
jgi:nucleoside-diphosphate-sugar epimerase